MYTSCELETSVKPMFGRAGKRSPASWGNFEYFSTADVSCVSDFCRLYHGLTKINVQSILTGGIRVWSSTIPSSNGK